MLFRSDDRGSYDNRGYDESRYDERGSYDNRSYDDRRYDDRGYNNEPYPNERNPDDRPALRTERPSLVSQRQDPFEGDPWAED